MNTVQIFAQLQSLLEGLKIHSIGNDTYIIECGRLQSEPLSLRSLQYLCWNITPLTVAEIHQAYRNYDYCDCTVNGQGFIAVKPVEKGYYQLQIGKGKYSFVPGNTEVAYIA